MSYRLWASFLEGTLKYSTSWTWVHENINKEEKNHQTQKKTQEKYESSLIAERTSVTYGGVHTAHDATMHHGTLNAGEQLANHQTG